MIISTEQKRIIDSVLSIFETGKIPTPSAYSTCSILTDGAGISYGKHQSTDKSGSLDKIVTLYVSKASSYSELLRQYLPKLAANETTKVDPKAPPQWVKDLIALLKLAGADPIMQHCQDEIFDTNYWLPSVTISESIGLKTALGYLTVYDTCIHSGSGGVTTIRNKFPEASPAHNGDEKLWIKAYVAARKAWLLSNSNPLVKKTIYRMEALEVLIAADNWDLVAPITVRGVKIS